MEEKYILNPGAKLKSPKRAYTIENVLGAGGFGITYKVSAKVRVDNVEVKTYFAVKEHFLKEACERDATDSICYSDPVKNKVEESRQDFLSEAQRLNRISTDHPNIVHVNEVFEANNTVYYVMEYLDGDSLRSYVKKHGVLSETEALALIRPIMEAVDYLHQHQMTHLDIKPDNIMLKQDEDTGRLIPVLIDFGLSKHYDESGNATSTIRITGCSDGYAPMEQYVGITTFTPQADVYALGATLYYMLVGRDPVIATEQSSGKIEGALPQDISATTRQAIVAAMKQSKGERTASVRLFFKGLCTKNVQGDDLKKEVDKETELENDTNRTMILGKKCSDSSQTNRNAAGSRLSEKAKSGSFYMNKRFWIIVAAIILLVGGVGCWIGIPISRESLCIEYRDNADACSEKKDFANEVMWFKKAANLGDETSMFCLGCIYKDGREGISPNKEEALKWFKMSAEMDVYGSIASQRELAELYLAMGNDAEAIKWYAKAAEKGCVYSQKMYDDLKNGEKITSGQIIDLGLSVKWAAWNVGASSPEEYGGLYGWADPTGENLSTNNDDYPSKGFIKDIAGTKYDIARVKWGGDWRMPTEKEFHELENKCQWKWISYKGKKGYKVTAANGNSIFLPAAGSRFKKEITDQSESGYYWSSTPDMKGGSASVASDIEFRGSDIFCSCSATNGSGRRIGHSVRPVMR